jgi:hypothetical protein
VAAGEVGSTGWMMAVWASRIRIERVSRGRGFMGYIFIFICQKIQRNIIGFCGWNRKYLKIQQFIGKHDNFHF